MTSTNLEASALFADFESLAEDVHLRIFSFLNVQALGNVMSVNRKCRQLLLSGAARLLWLEHCRQRWKIPMDADSEIVDSLSIPTAAGSHELLGANLRVLFSMTRSDLPTEIDPSYEEGIENYTDEATGEPLVRPFCAPYMDRDGSIQVTPRFVAYFEISILQVEEACQVDDLSSFDDDECTAIGVATASFPLRRRMPGWDRHSFGYHGDDGDVYHSSGLTSQPFGPTFGAGDTVGCGIDYVARSIFYTLNGNFLGNAWRDIDANFLHNNEWYPVVGVDTKSPISVNFGQKPFLYDLKSFNEEHETLISPFYQHANTTTDTPTAVPSR